MHWQAGDRELPAPRVSVAGESVLWVDPTDVSRMAGHANVRIMLDMYVGTTAGILDRARSAAE